MQNEQDASRRRCRLYIISPPALDPLLFRSSLTGALESGDVAAFQLRLPKASEDQWLRAIEALMPLTQEYDAAFIINDRVETAKKMNCDGVHLGAQDTAIRAARDLLGPDKIIGASCLDSRHLAMTAAERGADYVSFSPFFQSRSPFYPPEVMPPGKLAPADLLTWWQETMEVPCVAAGGITPANCGELVKAGADFICASTSVWEYPQGAAAAVRAFNDAMEPASKRR